MMQILILQVTAATAFSFRFSCARRIKPLAEIYRACSFRLSCSGAMSADRSDNASTVFCKRLCLLRVLGSEYVYVGVHRRLFPIRTRRRPWQTDESTETQSLRQQV